jgi:eukaryotic-like serine/threonine-protein kinase
MSELAGQTILHYKILEQIGQGGMGEVYKAQDTKLDRYVALKFLPSQLTASEDDKARFIQEAKAASAMNHPNVCTIYDIQENKGRLFIVMEYVDGKTLKDKKDSLSEKQILEIGVQTAEGLAAAHEKGIVHRDIKPENIMVRKDGIVQIMDFGLAKLYTSGNVSRLTKAGTTMGTMGYMSPEQVQGLDVDHRTDIFSLGVVLYEMLAGETPFKGVHETAIMYEIVNVDPPPISTVKEGIDPQIDEIILECLEKDKDERCQSAKELAKDLRKVKKSTGHRKSRVYSVNSKSYITQANFQPDAKSSGSITIEAFNKRIELRKIFTSPYLLWGIIGILFLTILFFEVLNKNQEEPQITSISSITAPENVQPVAIYGVSVISHDGKLVVFGGVDSTGNVNLWLRQMNSMSSRMLNGTQGAIYPFWSYDDKYVFFFELGKLKKIDIISGSVIDICDAIAGRGGTENKNGQIVFAPDATGGLYMVSANGGTPEEIIKPDSGNTEESLRFPFFLPDGEHFLYTIQAKFSGSTSGDVLKIGSVDSDFDKTLMQLSSNAEYANGYLFFVRQSTLMCQAFDPDSYELSGDINTISGNLFYFDPQIYSAFSLSNNGNLIFQNNSEADHKIVLTDIRGNIKEELFTKKIEQSAQFSPDGTKIAYDALGPDNKNADIWIYDMKRKISSRITFNPNYDVWPRWSPDEKYIAFSSDRGHTLDVFIKKADGTGSDSLIYHSEFSKNPTAWSSSGEYILFNSLNPKTKYNMGIIDLFNADKHRILLNSDFDEGNGSFSDDMKWIMYISNESGKVQTYVRPFNNNEGRWQISNNGGNGLKWIDNDKAVIYIWQNVVYKVKVDGSGQSFVAGKPEELFNATDKHILTIYDVTKDGKTFLGDISGSTNTAQPINYVQNWRGLLNKNEI